MAVEQATQQATQAVYWITVGRRTKKSTTEILKHETPAPHS